jgi:nuclear RNA export factor
MGPSIGFDISEDDHKLPVWKQAYICNENGQELVATFLKQYFAIYDSDNRQSLLEAYHDNAMFSITATSNQHYTREEM